MIVGDIRLDNTEELTSTLGLETGVHPLRIVGAAYRKWGSLFPKLFLGDFSVILFDPSKKRIVAARDHFGVRPLYYHLSDTRAAFASSVRLVAQLADLKLTPRPASMADFLAGIVPDTVSTFYEEVLRLPPGHVATVDPQTHSVAAYWELSQPSIAHRADAPGEFRSIFEEAVRCRYPEGSTTGIMLSGGMDSSAIACMAGQIARTDGRGRPTTLSATFNRIPEWNEQKYIDEVNRFWGCKVIQIDGSDDTVLEGIDEIFWSENGPGIAYGTASWPAIYKVAGEHGITTLLDGHGGDEVVSLGAGRLNELARERRWLKLLLEARGIAKVYGSSTFNMASPYFSHSATIRRLRARGAANRRSAPRQSIVAPVLAERTGLAERLENTKATSRWDTTEQDLHYSLIANPGQSYSLEILHSVAHAGGVRVAYPFLDRRLVEFCLSLPAKEKLDGGISRRVLRRGLRDILPPMIRRRPDKFIFSGILARALLQHQQLLTDLFEHDCARIGDYVNLPTARQALSELVRKGARCEFSNLVVLRRSAALAMWLRHTGAHSPRA